MSKASKQSREFFSMAKRFSYRRIDPETLPQVRAEKIAYLHLDTNCSPPEIAAIQFFWERLLPGAFVLFDDYAFCGCRSQKIAADRFAQEKWVKILSLPTGQGLLVKPRVTR